MKNTGKPAEAEFEAHFASLGKRAYVHRFVDAAEIKGRTGNAGHARPAPADYLVTYDERTFYAEVKSTENETRFPLSLLRKSQTAAARQVIAAGGDYYIFIKSIAHNTWYRVAYFRVCDAMDAGQKSFTWEEITPCLVTIAN